MLEAIVIGVLVIAAIRGWRKPHVWSHLRHVKPSRTQDASGWVYFAVGPDTPVQVGTSTVSPTGGLPELKYGCPVPMQVIHKIRTSDLAGTARSVVAELAPYHIREAWYDRDATMFYVDHLKGAC